MTDAEMQALLPILAQQPGQAAEQLRPLAEAGDDEAVVLYAWSMLQAGRWPEAIASGRRSLELGAVQIGGQYVANMIGQPDHEAEAFELLALALDAGWQVDPLQWVPHFAQNNKPHAIASLVKLASTPWPRSPDVELDGLLARIRSGRAEFEGESATVATAKSDAIAAIESHEAVVAQQRARLEDLGHKVEKLLHKESSDGLAGEYATHAKSAQRTAFLLSATALVVGFAAAVLAGYLTIKHASETDPNVLEGLAKASIALPIALFAAALGGLGARYRRMAWHWRHVELQLRTVEPYTAELEGDRRLQMIERLADRFFPGQALDFEGKEASS